MDALTILIATVLTVAAFVMAVYTILFSVSTRRWKKLTLEDKNFPKIDIPKSTWWTMVAITVVLIFGAAMVWSSL